MDDAEDSSDLEREKECHYSINSNVRLERVNIIDKNKHYLTIYTLMKAYVFNIYLYRHTFNLPLTCCMRTCPPVDHAGVWEDAQYHHLPPLEEDAGPDSCGTNHDYQSQQRDRGKGFTR